MTQVREAAGMKSRRNLRAGSPGVRRSCRALNRESGHCPPMRSRRSWKPSAPPEALQLSKALGRDWREIPRPPLDHPDQDLLWEAEQICRELVKLRNHPETRHAFERRLSEYIDEIKQTRHPSSQARARDRGHRQQGHRQVHRHLQGDRAGSARSRTARPRRLSSKPAAAASPSATSISAPAMGYGLLIEPCSDDEIRAHVSGLRRAHPEGKRGADRRMTMARRGARASRRKWSAPCATSRG